MTIDKPRAKEIPTVKNCRLARGDRPCAPHRETGITCESCPNYDPLLSRLLIIKLEAVGDVLRTTSILKPLTNKYPGAHITWITKSEASDLFENNPFVDRVLPTGFDALSVLLTENFDVVICLDTSAESTRLASLAKGDQKFGFASNKRGHVVCCNEAAKLWFEMGTNDAVKVANRRTYQDIMADICEIPKPLGRPLFFLSEDEKKLSEQFMADHRLKLGMPLIGVNSGAGARWRTKQWTLQGYVELIRRIDRKIPESRVLLFGGPQERERNNEIIRVAGNNVIDTGWDNSLRLFATKMAFCTALVTGDTLALHIALALEKPVVVLFGPTSAAEIDLYGKGRKLCSTLDCLCCYKTECKHTPNCMETITVQQVFSALKEILSECGIYNK